MWVLPGLINMHEHFMLRDILGDPFEAMRKNAVETTLVAVGNAREALARGWTTVREMGSTHGIAQELRDRIAAGTVRGPRVVTAGSPICVTGGHANALCVEADGVDACRRAARGQLKAGADFLKVMTSHEPYPMPGTEQTRAEMSPEEITAVFNEARSWGKGTACHAMGSTAIGRVIDAHVDIVDHGHYLNDVLAHRMAELGTYLCPTLSAYDRQTMNPKYRRTDEWIRAHEALVEPHQKAFRTAVREGVKIVAGTDTTGSYGEEVELIREGGMSPMDSILACTRTAAEALRLGDQIGRLDEGMVADVVLLDGDPMVDPRALDHATLVMKAGISYKPSELRS